MPRELHKQPHLSDDAAGDIGYRTDTIVALATPPGRGGVAVVRMSGAESLKIAQQLCSTPIADQPRHAHLTDLHAPSDKQILDKALVTYYKAPASFTGEDIVEISTHGGHVTPRRVIRTLTNLGARQAEPGEFSLRAFLNGKMNLAEAEALNLMVSSMSRRGQEAATNNLTGQLSREVGEVREGLIDLLTILEHELDFSEDEIDATSRQEIERILTQAIDNLSHLQETAPYGRIIRDGVRVILAGSPNSGKSSLFNALIGHERAIVTEIPGTTRDSLEAWIDIDGFPVCLVDTAGLRDSADTIERLGVERSRKELSGADIILLLDPEDPFSAELALEENASHILFIKSKADQFTSTNKKKLIQVSIQREDGLDDLLRQLKAVLRSYIPAGEGAIISSDRQLLALKKGLQGLERVKEQLVAGQSIDILSGEIRLAVDHLAEIIGETTSEDVIQRIFSEFCVGK
ncbi:MAG: tRNA uridine-5-carboxymethylaminomethyl(34) synthesis GTPase MnmE [Fidelibacterota bacterium]|nr:MAG: tRNA uridine-5-carboxymethylaminomethyl(34) synthesis GTPase MnmE [Candidatus Neomarinimicrobiota bacterium]